MYPKKSLKYPITLPEFLGRSSVSLKQVENEREFGCFWYSKWKKGEKLKRKQKKEIHNYEIV